jgi:membrane protein DedA with SNARE-associated domain
MHEWVTNTVESLGYAGILLLMFLENLFPPIPSELIMPLAGYTAREGDLTFWNVVLAGSAGATLGAIPWYLLGRAIGPERLKNLVRKHGRWIRVKVEDVERAESWFDRYGSVAIFVGRLVPGIRTLISVPAGFARMRLVNFCVWTILGTVLWTTFLAGSGWVLRENYSKIEPYVSTIGKLALVGVVIWIVVWIARRRRASRVVTAGSSPPGNKPAQD